MTEGSSGVKKPQISVHENIPPLDYSFMRLSDAADALEEEPRVSKKDKDAHGHTSSEGRSLSRCLRLNNNNLTSVSSLPEVIPRLFENPDNLGWIDLSFNELPTIDEALIIFPNLEILYLHGNLITDLKEVDKLQHLKKLKKLTLHGNEVEGIKGYKWYVLGVVPWILNFDFCAVTKADRKTAATMQRFNAGRQKPKKGIDED